MKRILRPGLLFVGLLAFACTTDKESSDAGKGYLIVANRGGSSLARFAHATTVNGNVVPKNYVRGGLTRLQQPGYLLYDSGQDRMYVPNAGDNQILIFDQFSTLTENVAPTTYLQGAGTQLSRPVQIKLDAGRSLMYVANAGSNAVTVYNTSSSLQGNIAPVRQLSGGSTKIGGISSIELDVANDRLWVADPVGNSLLVFENASSLNGNVPPTRQLSGTNSRLQAPQFLLLDGNRLFVSNTSGWLRFEDSTALSGDVAPTAVVTGADTGLSRPQQIVLDTENDELYVADSGTSAILIFKSPRTASGAPPPTRKISGSNPGFSDVSGLVLDLTHSEPDSTTSSSTSTSTSTSSSTSSSP